MIKFLFYCFLAYLLYQLVFKFIIPIYRTTRQVRKSFRHMQEQMNQYGQQQQQYYNNQHSQPPPKEEKSKGVAGDYIEFEEIPTDKS